MGTIFDRRLTGHAFFGPAHSSGLRVNQDLIRHEQVRRNSEFGTSGGFEFPSERASVLYWSEWHKRRLRLRVR
jgi:hypothetical protein